MKYLVSSFNIVYIPADANESKSFCVDVYVDDNNISDIYLSRE